MGAIGRLILIKRSIGRRAGRKLAMVLDREDAWIRRNEGFREQERAGVIARPNYCYGMLRAADQAKYLGYKETTIVEFGVANGAGLLNMIELAGMVQSETGVRLNVIGFDAGDGLPRVQGYRDHAELWRGGDFAMQDREKLLRGIEGHASLIFGDVATTVDLLKPRISPENPLGFISVDVDIYTATVSTLRCLEWPSDLYLPGVSMYFDDTAFFFANEWAGELLAINEFNARNRQRKIGEDRSFPGRRRRKAAPWYRGMFVCHVLDHEIRNRGFHRTTLSIDRHHEFMTTHGLY